MPSDGVLHWGTIEMADTKYLQWHGQQWRVQVKIPPRLRPIFGKSKLVEPLHTASLKEANDLKHAVVAKFKALLREAARALDSDNPMLAEAFRYRVHIPSRKPPEKGLRERRGTATLEDWQEADYGPNDGDEYAALLRAEEIEASQGVRVAQAFYRIATRRENPLEAEVEAFAHYNGYRQKTVGDLDRAIRHLSNWLGANGLPRTIEAVDRRAAGSFIDTSLSVGRSRKKAAAYLSLLRGYWGWLGSRGQVSENPWLGQKVPKGSSDRDWQDKDRDDGKRPFTDAEVAQLLGGHADPTLFRVMVIGTLSAMRIEEICQLRVKDCGGDIFSVRGGKTKNARRDVPIHSGLRGLVAALIEGRQNNDYLIADLPKVPPSRETRSDPIGKRFTRFRRKCGIDERPNGKAKSNVDFHSFRRWFIRKARDAWLDGTGGFDAWTIAEIVGHHVDSILEGLGSLSQSHRDYAGNDPVSARQAAVEAVRLPLELDWQAREEKQ